MKILNVARMGNPVLRQKAQAVLEEKIKEKETQDLIDEMVMTMRSEDGVGLAGPQVHQPLRIFVVEIPENRRDPENKATPLTVFINPRIVDTSKTRVIDWEGCISVPDIKGKVSRYQKVTVIAYDREGKPFTVEAQGLFARVIQHENDHLDGILFLERVDDIKSLTFLKEYLKYQQPAE